MPRQPHHRTSRALRALTAIALALTLSLALALELVFLDVGQGSSVLIRSPEGHTVLYDAGDNAANTLAQLHELDVARLDLIIASHAHADHIGGMSDVLDALPPTFYIDNGVPHTTVTYERTLESLEASGARLLEPTRRTIGLGNATLTIVPPPRDPNLGHNNNSIGVLIAYHDFRAFLPGDAEPDLWNHWLTHHPDLIQPVQVHLASHHGSRNGDTPEALARLTPTVIVIQTGTNNPYDHPHDEALALYHQIGATVLRNDHHGRISVRVEPDSSYRIYIEKQP